MISPIEVDEWSFEQIDSVLRGGKPAKGIPFETIEQAREINRNWRKYYGI